MEFRNLSIRKKLITLMMLISTLILLLVSSIYLFEEIYSSRTFLKREMITLGATLGDSCKKLLMSKEIEATEQILASLSVQPNIRAAYLFDEAGQPVAQYIDPSDTQYLLKIIPRDFSDPSSRFWAELPQPYVTSSWRHFGVFLPIQHDTRQIGSIYLLSDLRDLYGRLSGVVFLVSLLLGLLLFLSWWFSGKLQRPVSAPLLSLVETMSSISQSKDYSLRAKKEGRDEIGLLVDGFNQMLEQIETHRQELVAHQQTLEQTVEDRTEELREMVGVLEQAKQQAEAASEAKSQFLANITHELRTPLIGVLGMNELLFRTAMDEQQRMLASTVQKSGEDLLTLINNVLDFSKMEAGKMQLEEIEFALYQTLEDVLNLLAGAAAEKRVSLYSHVPLSATCRVLGDEVRVRQILMNLIGNAIKFTEQGEVTVKLDCQRRGDAQAEFSIEIIDTGIGMDAEAQRQAFSVFYQADSSHTRNYGGTGLGLAIVQQLVQLLGGDLSLESSVGTGSCFKVDFRLPLVSDPDIHLPASLQRQTVLVFAADPINQQLLVKRLQELELAVVAAESAADAWYQLGSAARSGRPFQMAFLSADALLPDGQPFYLAIREANAYSGLRRFLLLNRSHTVDLLKQERCLFLPLGWDDLCETLCRSWHELHLVEKKPVEPDVETVPQAVCAGQLLLVGGSVASRELIKVVLHDLQLVIDSAKDFTQLTEKTDQAAYTAILLDPMGLPPDRLLDYCRQQQAATRMFVLYSSADDVEPFAPYVAGTLEKPFKREQFLPLLQPLLTGGGNTDQKPAVDKGGAV